MTDYFALAVSNARDEFQAEQAVAERVGPRQCCADAGRVVTCDGDTDLWECWICGRTWEAPCR
jgi:hypothetical protein